MPVPLLLVYAIMAIDDVQQFVTLYLLSKVPAEGPKQAVIVKPKM